MKDNSTSTLNHVIEMEERKLEDHRGRIVRGTVEAMLNALLDAEADALCGAARSQRSLNGATPGRQLPTATRDQSR